jgi:hypothetical protein
LVEILAEREEATNVAANVQKTAGSTGIGVVDEEVWGGCESVFCVHTSNRGTVLRRPYVKTRKTMRTYVRFFRFSRNLLCSKNLEDYHKKGQRHASPL